VSAATFHAPSGCLFPTIANLLPGRLPFGVGPGDLKRPLGLGEIARTRHIDVHIGECEVQARPGQQGLEIVGDVVLANRGRSARGKQHSIVDIMRDGPVQILSLRSFGKICVT